MRVSLWAGLAFVSLATTLGSRCVPETDDQVTCRCLDWSSKKVCSPMLFVVNEEECEAVGGFWGRDQADIYGSFHPPTCTGTWMNKESRQEAQQVYDTIMAVRAKDNPNTQQHLSQSDVFQARHVFGGHVDLTNEPKQDTTQHHVILSPSFGPSSGGVWVQVMGAGSFFTPNSVQCKMDLIEQFCYSNHYMYTWCYMTPKCAGVYDFHCHNGPLKFEGKYAVVAKVPWVTSVYPFSGDTHGGSEVTVRGWNFEPHCPSRLLCRFGSLVVPAKYYTSSSIMCVAPCAHQKGFVSVEVSNDGGMHWSMSGVQFGYVGDDLDESVLGGEECSRYVVSSAAISK